LQNTSKIGLKKMLVEFLFYETATIEGVFNSGFQLSVLFFVSQAAKANHKKPLQSGLGSASTT
jgi:hypothetical protein